MIRVVCSYCLREGQVPEDLAFKKLRCKKCGNRFIAEPVEVPVAQKAVDDDKTIALDSMDGVYARDESVDWYYRNGKSRPVFGPTSLPGLLQFAQTEPKQADAAIRHGANEAWIPVSKVSQLLPTTLPDVVKSEVLRVLCGSQMDVFEVASAEPPPLSPVRVHSGKESSLLSEPMPRETMRPMSGIRTAGVLLIFSGGLCFAAGILSIISLEKQKAAAEQLSHTRARLESRLTGEYRYESPKETDWGHIYTWFIVGTILAVSGLVCINIPSSAGAEGVLTPDGQRLPLPDKSHSNPNLKPCPDCKRLVSQRATACPGCGCPLDVSDDSDIKGLPRGPVTALAARQPDNAYFNLGTFIRRNYKDPMFLASVSIVGSFIVLLVGCPLANYLLNNITFTSSTVSTIPTISDASSQPDVEFQTAKEKFPAFTRSFAGQLRSEMDGKTITHREKEFVAEILIKFSDDVSFDCSRSTSSSIVATGYIDLKFSLTVTKMSGRTFSDMKVGLAIPEKSYRVPCQFKNGVWSADTNVRPTISLD